MQLPPLSVTSQEDKEPYGPALPQPRILHQPTQSTSVITRKQIELMSPSSLTDILQQLPGVTVSRAGGIGGQVRVRGLNTNDFRVPLFVNGVRFRGRNTLQFLFFEPEDVERVEVIRGPASSLYGSDALGGLINIVTRKAKGDPNGPARVGAGTAFTFGSAAGTANTHVDAEATGFGFDARLSFGTRHGDNYQSPIGEIPNTDFQTLGGSATFGYTPAAGHRIGLDLRSERDSDGSAGAPGAPFIRARNADNRVDMANLSYSGTFEEGLFRQVHASVYVNNFYTKLTNTNNSVLRRTTFTESDVIGPLVYGGRAYGEIPWNLAGTPAKTTVGADFNDEQRPGSLSTSQTINRNVAGNRFVTTNVNTAQTGPYTSQTSFGLFALQEWTPAPEWTVTGGARYDVINTRAATSPVPNALLPLYQAGNNVTNNALTGSVGLAYRPVNELEFFGNAATSFRAPTTFDKYNFTVTSSGFMLPNPNLVPETGLTFEVGYRLRFATASLTATAFHNEFANFIETVPVGFGNTQRQNVGSVNMNGVELEGRWQVRPEVTFFGAASTLTATNTTTNTPSPFIVPVYGNLGVQYAPADTGVSLVGRMDWALSKTRIDPLQEYSTGGYAILNLYATLNLAELVSPQFGDSIVTIGVENILNTAYQTGSTVPSMSYPQSVTNPLIQPGRNIMVTLRNRF
ncbi:MAG: TonB-dependent receptor [Reyranella sp.]